MAPSAVVATAQIVQRDLGAGGDHLVLPHHPPGAVDDEVGSRASIALQNDTVGRTSYQRLFGTYDKGFPLSIGHSSVWWRSSAGVAAGDRTQPFANFYFGAFGNNYVDHGNEKRYREFYALPGVRRAGVGGRTFVKSMVEWNLPPWRFSRVGTPGFYLTWIRPAVFVGGLATNLDAPGQRRTVADAGAQFDLQINMLSELSMTLSVGGAIAFDRGKPRREAMLSLKLLR
jgi:hypothetical protein